MRREVKVENRCPRRKLSDREKRFSAFERELLAIFASLLKWRDIIYGVDTRVFTDHKPIIGAFNNSKLRISDKQQWQFSFIGQYISDIIHISGKDNVVADTLSRSIKSITVEEQDHLLSLPCDLIGIAGTPRKKFKIFRFPVTGLQMSTWTS